MKPKKDAPKSATKPLRSWWGYDQPVEKPALDHHVRLDGEPANEVRPIPSEPVR